MAGSVGEKKGLRADINVTPLIDVVLVLLIVFIVLVPTLYVKNASELAVEQQDINQPTQAGQVVIKVDQMGKIFIEDKEVTKNDLSWVLIEKFKMVKNKAVFFDPHPSVSYTQITEIMDICRLNGAQIVGFLLQPKDTKPST